MIKPPPNCPKCGSPWRKELRVRTPIDGLPVETKGQCKYACGAIVRWEYHGGSVMPQAEITELCSKPARPLGENPAAQLNAEAYAEQFK